jgi:hypothetical protein
VPVSQRRTPSIFVSQAREWSERGQGNRWSKEEVGRGALDRLNGRARDGSRHTMPARVCRQHGHQDTGAASIMMDVQTRLALIVLRAVIRRFVVVMLANLLIMVVMMSMMDMASLVMPVDVEQNVGERSRRHRVGHADYRRERKCEHHRPNEGDTASACSLESRQHAILFQPSSTNDPNLALLRRKAQARLEFNGPVQGTPPMTGPWWQIGNAWGKGSAPVRDGSQAVAAAFHQTDAFSFADCDAVELSRHGGARPVRTPRCSRRGRLSTGPVLNEHRRG